MSELVRHQTQRHFALCLDRAGLKPSALIQVHLQSDRTREIRLSRVFSCGLIHLFRNLVEVPSVAIAHLDATLGEVL